MFIGPCIVVIVEEWKTNLMSLSILFHFLCAQHFSDINISIIRSLRLCCWITTSVVLFSVRCVLEIWWDWFWVVFVLQALAWGKSDSWLEWTFEKKREEFSLCYFVSPLRVWICEYRVWYLFDILYECCVKKVHTE